MRKINPKKEYLLGKMFDGAVALRDFFETMESKRDAIPVDVAEQLKEKYQLTDNQGKYLNGVAERTSKARGVVQYLERRFGLNEDRTFQDPRGLHDFLFNGYTPKRLEARTYDVGIGFTQGVWRDNEKMGCKHIEFSEYDCLRIPLKKTISRLERGADSNCQTLVFRIPGDSRMAKNAKRREEKFEDLSMNEKLTNAIFGGPKTTPEGLKQEIINHEMRHVVDTVIGKEWYDFFGETQAYLASGGDAKYGLRIDFEKEKERMFSGIENKRNAYEKFYNSGIPEVIINSAKKRLEISERNFKKLKEELPKQYKLFYDLIMGGTFVKPIVAEKLRKKDLSYLFSTMPRHKVFKRIADVTIPFSEKFEELKSKVTK